MAEAALNQSRPQQRADGSANSSEQDRHATYLAGVAALHASSINDSVHIRKTASYAGWLAMLIGDSRAAEEHFLSADRLELASKHYKKHLYSLRGTWWAEFLIRTGRIEPARTLTDDNRLISTLRGWNEDVARCDRLLARLDLIAGDPIAAMQRLITAATAFREGYYLVELAATLPVLAESARASGDLAAANRHVEEALSITGPRGLLISHAAALLVRARLCADQVSTGGHDHLARGRDAADAAHRVATRHQLAWHELDALDIHSHLDRIEGTDHNWTQRAATLRARLIPAGLDPDPLMTVEHQVLKRQRHRRIPR